MWDVELDKTSLSSRFATYPTSHFPDPEVPITLRLLTKLLPGSDEIKHVKMPRPKESGAQMLKVHVHIPRDVHTLESPKLKDPQSVFSID